MNVNADEVTIVLNILIFNIGPLEILQQPLSDYKNIYDKTSVREILTILFYYLSSFIANLYS